MSSLYVRVYMLVRLRRRIDHEPRPCAKSQYMRAPTSQRPIFFSLRRRAAGGYRPAASSELSTRIHLTPGPLTAA